MRFFSLRYKIMLIILLPLLVFSVTIGVLGYFDQQEKLLAHYEELSRQTESNIINTVNLIDKSYRMIENFLSIPMEETFNLFREEYVRAGFDPDRMDLFKIKNSLSENIDLYIIKDGIITHTTFEQVLGIDFKVFPDFYQRLEKIRISDKVIHDRLSVELTTGKIRLWSFLSSPDHKYVFELGLAYEKIKDITGSMDLTLLTRELKNYNPTLEDVRIYDRLGLEITGGSGQVYLDEKTLKNVKKNKTYEIKDKKAKTITRYIYVKLEHDELKPSNPSKIIKLVYNISHIDVALKNAMISLVIANIIYLFFFTLLVFIFSRIITRPIINLHNKIKQISRKNFESRVTKIPNDEIGELGLEFNKMADIIQGYTEDLEFLVEDKTKQMNNVLKELKEEFEMARKIQLSIIPTDFPQIEDIHLSGRYVPMNTLGGDYYDAFRIGKNKVVLIIADVCGHGVPAALITTMAKISFFSHSKAGRSSDDIVSRVNKVLYKVIGNKEFMTVFYGIIDFETMELDYTNAGHICTYIIRGDGTILNLEATSPFIGYSLIAPFEAKKIKIKQHDKIILHTDGIVDAKNKEGKFFSEQRFVQVIKKNRKMPPEKIVDAVFNEVAAFREIPSYEDDMALLVGKIK